MKRIRQIMISAFTSIALAGCGSPAHDADPAPTPATQSPAAPAPAPALPTASELRAGLVTAAELGPPYKAESPADESAGAGATAGGCKELASLLNSPSAGPDAHEASASANFSGGPIGPLVTHALASEPEAALDRSYKLAAEALASCTHLTFTEDGKTMSLDLSPIHFEEGATAARLDGTTREGVQVNGYLAMRRISGNVIMTFVYMQAGSDSSQEASHLYTLAADKAAKAFPGP